MKRTIIFTILIGLVFTVFPARSQCKDVTTTSKVILDDLQRGFWLNKAYLTKLMDTKSPRKASLHIYEAGFWIKKEDTNYQVWVLYNFHDSGTAFKITDIRKSNSTDAYDLSTTPDQYADIKEQSVTLIKEGSADEILWRFTSKDNKKHDLVFMRIEPNLDEYVNTILLAGEYRDKNNQIYKFTKNGTAIWPERTFNYKIDLDFVMIDNPERDEVCDSIVNVEKQGRKVRSVTAWGFEVQRDGLIIYEPNKSIICGKRILHSLRRVNAQ